MVFFSPEDINRLASPFRMALVGKFSRGRPKLEEIRKFIHFLDLKDACSVGHMDACSHSLCFRNKFPSPMDQRNLVRR